MTAARRPDPLLPPRFSAWFSARGWTPRQHQLDLLAAAEADEDALLIAPTGAGKTLAGFLPSLVDLTERPRNRGGLHTLYISPLKALAVDVERNLAIPAADLRLGLRIETRTGDTSVFKRKRQRADPPDILLTTPEQVALLLASPDAAHLFADLRRVVFDELHAIVAGKRGDLLALDLARLRRLAPMMRATGLSATVRDPAELQRWLVPQPVGSQSPSVDLMARRPQAVSNHDVGPEPAGALVVRDALRAPHHEGIEAPPSALARLVVAPPGAKADLSILDTEQRMPWSGHSARHALAEVYERLKHARMALIFTNTRSQAEFIFQALWAMNDDALPIALHHGSLDAGQRRRVEAAMAEGRLRAVVCTSTLDLGIDWGDVDLVVNIGAPKGSSRLMQRIGRANHRLDEPSVAVLVPSNRFEVLECRAAVDAAEEGAQDTAVARAGALDVMCQHILGMACAAPFSADELYAEIASAEPYRMVDRQTFDKALAFVAHGGYALAGYERFAKIKQPKDGLWRVANGRVAQAYRMNVGTIVEASVLKVRLVRNVRAARKDVQSAKDAKHGKTPNGAGDAVYTGPLGRVGRVLGEIEEGFLESLAPGDTFLFGGEILALQGIVENEALVSRARSDTPRVPTYAGGKFPLSTYLAERVRKLLADPDHWGAMPMQVAEWLGLQAERSALPPPGDLLVETFPRGGRNYLVCYPFEGRLAHQTLGMLLTRRMERAYLQPLGFVANDYAMAVWLKTDVGLRIRQGLVSLDTLFAQDMLGDDLEEWLQESFLMKRTFRQNAIVSGLIERNFPGKEKTGRQITISTDLIYDVLRRHEPDHILLQAARQDASTGLLDLVRLGGMLARIQGRILHKDLEKISPLAVPIMLEVGREKIDGDGRDAILAEAEAELVREAVGAPAPSS